MACLPGEYARGWQAFVAKVHNGVEKYVLSWSLRNTASFWIICPGITINHLYSKLQVSMCPGVVCFLWVNTVFHRDFFKRMR